jgi:hypothetical protein
LIGTNNKCCALDSNGSDVPMFYDDFSDNRAEGAVIGTQSTDGHKRLGVDEEKVFSIDNGALRIAPLIEAGFGRAVIAYGPFSRRAGMAFSIRILNGHNTAQAESLPETFRERMALWCRGNGCDPKWRRLIQWITSGRVRRTFRQFRWWMRTAKNSAPVQPLNENLAVGWFPMDVVANPRDVGNAFIMHALGPENGELWAGGNGTRTRSLRGVQNLPLYLLSILRPDGAIYYISSVAGAPGIGPHPYYRPVALEHGPVADELYLGIQQGVLGQIGWRLDTRLKGVRVASLEGYESWCGGAHAADRLTGNGDLDGSLAETGGTWRVFLGKIWRGADGATRSTGSSMSVLRPVSPTGLIHAAASPGMEDQGRVGLIWRFVDERNHWRMEVGRGKYEVILVVEGERQVLASTDFPDSAGNSVHRIQVLDDGRHMMAYVDGVPLVDGYIKDMRLEGATGVGILLDDPSRGEGTISSFEAHPRSIEMPKSLSFESPWFRKGTCVVAADDFSGQPEDLEGRSTPVGGRPWSRTIGSGLIGTTGSGAARIKGTVRVPCPGRTAYCIDWEHPDFADLEAIITPPGTQSGEKEMSIAGFILYQDTDNYVTLNVWRADDYGGSSISTFFKFAGFEDLYDAIWTNVGNRVYYGKPSRLRLCCDGEQYLVFVNDEPVLYRAFRDVYADVERLRIRKVGLLANWEFGNDTGSRFEQFRARF